MMMIRFRFSFQRHGGQPDAPVSEFNRYFQGGRFLASLRHLPMPRILSSILSILISANAIYATANQVQSAASSPQVVLEATNTTRGIGGYKNESLLVRLTDDGKVQWDKVEWDKLGRQYARERQVSTVSAEMVSEIKHALITVDDSRVRSKMEPYYITLIRPLNFRFE
jgi:hypothetical protein